MGLNTLTTLLSTVVTFRCFLTGWMHNYRDQFTFLWIPLVDQSPVLWREIPVKVLDQVAVPDRSELRRVWLRYSVVHSLCSTRRENVLGSHAPLPTRLQLLIVNTVVVIRLLTVGCWAFLNLYRKFVSLLMHTISPIHFKKGHSQSILLHLHLSWMLTEMCLKLCASFIFNIFQSVRYYLKVISRNCFHPLQRSYPSITIWIW